MRRLLFSSLLVLGTFCWTLSPPAFHAAAKSVEYTWTLAALGQGGWIGGPLFDDGTVGGGGAFSVANGQVVARFEPTWTENASEEISVCFDVTIRKGPPNALPPTICTPPTEPTGTAVKIFIFGSEHIFRITENH